MNIVIRILITFLASCSANAFAQAPPPAKVVLAEIGQQEVAQNQSFLGLLYYDRVSHVSSEVAGLVETVTVREGDMVKAGSPLVYLDTEIRDKEIAGAKIRVAQIELRIRQAGKNYKRLEKLHAEHGASEKNYEDAFYAYEDLLREKEAAEVELETLLVLKRKSIIKAPFDGVILEKKVDSGDWIQQGTQMAVLGSTKDLFVRVPLAETLLQYIHKGEEVVVVFNALQKEMKGIIDDFSPIADAKTKNIFLKVRMPHMTNVAENMSVQVYVPTSDRRTYSVIPRDALIKFQGGDFVYTVKEGKAAILPANIVTYLGDRVAVDNPYFVVGMQVVVEGNERLRPDQPVIVAGAE